ncbi:MAG: AMIN domain-containing protein [Gammaproteobacteria bacterium]|nr:AMIN domain-containing protein [Gammaproteobacteria bacterium]
MRHQRGYEYLVWTVFLLCSLFSAQWVYAAEIQGVRLWAAPDNTRIVFDTSAAVQHSLFTLKNPDRVVIDLKGSQLTTQLRGLDFSKGYVSKIRSASRGQDDLRIVLDLKDAVRPRSFSLMPNGDYGYRLVVDLFARADKVTHKKVRTIPQAETARDLVIAIDAGHGGEDPGAGGRSGTKEKDVMLAVARRLAKLVDREPGMRAVLIRDGDYFIRLRDRVRKARKHKADLFISIHADAFRDRRARGSSVYVLSDRGASSEMARWLARRENNADLVGGVSLDDKDDLLKSVLLDLSRSHSIEASMKVGGNILDGLKNIGRVHKRKVQHAGFAVLKSLDVPSILVETAFISNPKEERQLRDPGHQDKLANAMLVGIRAYFRKNPPLGSLLARRD